MKNAPLVALVSFPSFDRAAKGLLTEEDRAVLDNMLANNPEAGDVMVGTGGFRKVRFAREGEGKSGGVRVIYFFRSNAGRIYLLMVYAKNRTASLTGAEKNELKAIAKALNGE